VIGYPRAREITLTYDPRAGSVQAGTVQAVKAAIAHAS
jgi:hypothetical protein